MVVIIYPWPYSRIIYNAIHSCLVVQHYKYSRALFVTDLFIYLRVMPPKKVVISAQGLQNHNFLYNRLMGVCTTDFFSTDHNSKSTFLDNARTFKIKYLTIICPREWHAIVLQLNDSFGGLSAHVVYCVLVTQPIRT